MVWQIGVVVMLLRMSLVAVASSLTLAGCILPEQHVEDQTDLAKSMELSWDRLIAGEQARNKMTLESVKITNGAGQLVYEDTSSIGSITGETDRFEPKAPFDGELNIETTWADGTTHTQTLRHDPDRSLLLSLDRETRNYVAVDGGPDYSKRFALNAGVFGGRASFPAFNAFTEAKFNQGEADEDYLGIEDADEFGVDLEFSYLIGRYKVGPLGSSGYLSDIRVGGGFQYVDGSGSDSRETPIGGGDVAIVYPFEVNNSTGLFYGDQGASANTKLDYDIYNFSGFIEQANADLGSVSEGLTYTKRLDLNLEHGDYTNESFIQNLSFPDVTTSERIKLDYYRFGFDVGGTLDQRLAAGFSTFLAGELGGYYQTAHLDGWQESPGFTDKLHFDDSDSGFGFRSRLETGFKYRFSDSWDAKLGVYGEYDTSVPSVDRKTSPTDGPDRIDTGTGWGYGGSIRATYKF